MEPADQTVLRSRYLRISTGIRRYPLAIFIRVIVLHPSISEGDDLCCDVELVDIDREFYTYDGISYCWGEASLIEALYCGTDHQELRITRALASALRRFRRQSTTRRLWADAVCINQCDHEERAHQVALMSLVYQRARSVLIYLGDPLPDQGRYMECLLKLASLAGDSIKQMGILSGRNDGLIKQAMLATFGEVNSAIVTADLTRLPWFGRRWVIRRPG